MGANSREDGVDLTQFGLPLAFILGIIGMLYHASKDQKMAFSVLSLFIMTGYAIIIYLNQDDPQPRERDYSYVGVSLLLLFGVGLGSVAIGEKVIEKIKNIELAKRLVLILIVLQLIFVPFYRPRQIIIHMIGLVILLPGTIVITFYSQWARMVLFLQMEIMILSHSGIYRRLKS